MKNTPIPERLAAIEEAGAALSALILKMAEEAGAFRKEAGPLTAQLVADLHDPDPAIRRVAEASLDLTVNELLARARRTLRPPIHDGPGAPVVRGDDLISQVNTAVAAGAKPTVAAREILLAELGHAPSKGQVDYLVRKRLISRG